jgi:hypothetical protein
MRNHKDSNKPRGTTLTRLQEIQEDQVVKLPAPIYSKLKGDDAEVLVFGKSPQTAEDDRRKQLARFGGPWRQPAYDRAYLRAARVLSETAKLNDDLDQLGLPIFYLQRHALELFIKGLLHMLYDIADMRQQLVASHGLKLWLPSEGQFKRLATEHKLAKLLADLIKTSHALDVIGPPKIIGDTVDLFERYEVEPTWARYPQSQKGTVYLTKETLVPTIDMQTATERVFEEIGFKTDDPEPFEPALYYEWNSLMGRIHEGHD